MKLFRAEERQALKRLSVFAITGQQLAINSWVTITEEEKRQIETVIVAQKVATPNKVCKMIEEHKAEARKLNIEPSIKLKKTRIEMNSIIKWKRKVMKEANAKADEEESRKQDERKAPKYKKG